MRQKCVYQVLSEEKNANGTFTKWFNYVLNYLDTCDKPESINADCANKVMKDIGIDIEQVSNCYLNSYVKNAGKVVDNKILKEDREWSQRLGIILHPAITINNITYRGDLNGYDIFRAVCAGFKDVPNICKGDNVFEVVGS